MAFYLTGSFNNWRPDDPDYLFHEVTDPYGGQRPDLTLALGSYFLETNMPQKRIQFKIVENGSWEPQWSVNVAGNSGEIERNQFETRHGLKPSYIICREKGDLPQAEYNYPGDKMHWDFHPESRTLTIHKEFQRTAGVSIQDWKQFKGENGEWFDTYCCLPYGYDPDRKDQCSTSILFDGRGLIFGEDANFDVWNEPRRQWLRVLDTLARHGIITPTVVIAVSPPCRGDRMLRPEGYCDTEASIHKWYTQTICTRLLPSVEKEFRVIASPDQRYLLGHSNGGDIVLSLITQHSDLFGGAVAHSPGYARRALDLPSSSRSRVRLALSYTSQDLSPNFVTPTARIRLELEKANIQHLLQYIPDAKHDPATIQNYLHPSFAYVMR